MGEEISKPIKRYISKDTELRFLNAFARTMNVSLACKQAGLKSTGNLYDQRKVDPELARKWQEIEDQKLDELEEHIWNDAKDHREDRKWVLSRRRPDKWSEKRTVAGKMEIHKTVDVTLLTTKELQQIAAQEIEEAEYEESDSRPPRALPGGGATPDYGPAEGSGDSPDDPPTEADSQDNVGAGDSGEAGS